MDRSQPTKADNVVCWRQGKKVTGSVHVKRHHLVFQYQLPGDGPMPQESPKSHKETWIGFPLIGTCTYRPSAYASHIPPSIRLRCRDFTFIAFHFATDPEAREIFEIIKASTCKLNHVDQLLAYSYHSTSAEKAVRGWDLYDARRELARMGISEKSRDKGWRISTINSHYTYSPTYPALLCVPSIISDTTLKHTASFRSKARIPVLTYLHAMNNCTITRCAQPSVGIRQSRSPQDEKLVNAIFSTTKPSLKFPSSGAGTPRARDSTADLPAALEDVPGDVERLSIEEGEADDVGDTIDISQVTSEQDATKIVRIYGAQQTNMIIDARPSVNAMANHAIGYGSENMEGYPNVKKIFLGIDNIHVMRKSLEDVVDALKDSDLTTLPPMHSLLEKSKWRKHIGLLLSGTLIISNTIAIQHSHVLIHCSDGWDRTSQLSALSQLCLDPYYRTLEGFMVLVEKDWMSFGYMFRLRSGLLSHEKWFDVENERTNANRSSANGTGQDPQETQNPFESAIARAQGFFRRKPENSDDVDSESVENSPLRNSTKRDENMATRLKDVSPIFHQFLDACYQLIRQFPTRFEFNERFLRRLYYHVYSCQYGNFLFNNQKELVEARAKEKTKSVWSYFLSRRQQFVNEKYDAVIDENDKERTSLISPHPEDVVWWHELFGRTEQEMKGPVLTNLPSESSSMTGIEIIDSSSGPGTTVMESSGTGSSTINTSTGIAPSLGKTNDGSTRFARFESDSKADLTTDESRPQPKVVEAMTEEGKEESPATGWLPSQLSGKRLDPLGAGVELD